MPHRVLTKAELSRQLGVDIDAFVSGTHGIRERRWCASDESTADLVERGSSRTRSTC